MVYDYYLVVLFLLAFVGLTSFYNKKELSRVFFTVMLFSLFIGLRGADAGSDTINYVKAYNAINTSVFSYSELAQVFVENNITAAEPGFLAVSYIVKFLEVGDTGYLVIICFLSLFLLYFGFKKITPFSLLALVLYCCSISLISLQGNVMRQGLAAPLIIIAIGFLVQNKRREFVFFGVIASLFHVSALVVFLSIFMVLLTVKVRYYIYVLFTLMVLLYSGVISKLGSSLLTGLFAAKFTSYFNVGFSSLFTFKLLSFFVFLFLCLYLRYINKDSFYKFKIDYILACYFCLFYLQFVFSGDEVASERFGLYRFTLEPIILSFIPVFFKDKFNLLVLLVFIAFLYGVIVYNLPSVKEMLINL